MADVPLYFEKYDIYMYVIYVHTTVASTGFGSHDKTAARGKNLRRRNSHAPCDKNFGGDLVNFPSVIDSLPWIGPAALK